MTIAKVLMHAPLFVLGVLCLVRAKRWQENFAAARARRPGWKNRMTEYEPVLHLWGIRVAGIVFIAGSLHDACN